MIKDGKIVANEKIRDACYRCRHVGEVAGSAHKSCRHPRVLECLGTASGLFELLTKPGNLIRLAVALEILGDERGVDGGWFNWPVEFDPVWLLSCAGFELKEGVKV